MDDWTTVPMPALQIVSDELWAKVQTRKAQTRKHYIRAADGRLLSKPEAGLVARFVLKGIGRCPCGGGLTVISKARAALGTTAKRRRSEGTRRVRTARASR